MAISNPQRIILKGSLYRPPILTNGASDVLAQYFEHLIALRSKREMLNKNIESPLLAKLLIQDC